MKTLEVRRHSFTRKGDRRDRGSSLSAEGVLRARELGSNIGPFAYVIASLVPRTLETALAMGFAVDELVEMGGEEWPQASAKIDHRSVGAAGDLYLIYVDRFRAGGAVASLGRRQAELWGRAVQHVDEGQAALVISHGGLIEPGLIAALPAGWDHSRWGSGFAPCEGARLFWDGRFTDAKPVRTGDFV